MIGRLGGERRKIFGTSTRSYFLSQGSMTQAQMVQEDNMTVSFSLRAAPKLDTCPFRSVCKETQGGSSFIETPAFLES